MLDPADGGIDHGATGKAREIVHGGPQVLDVAGIFSQQPALEIADGGDCGFVGTDRISFAPASDALISKDFDEAQVARFDTDQKALYVGDLERGFARKARSVLSKG